MLGLLLAIGLSAPAYAAVIVSQPHNPSFIGQFSNFVDGVDTSQQTADDFTLAAPTTLTALSWTGQYFTEQTSLTNPVTFRIRFFEDNSGEPGATPTTTVDVAVTGTATGTSFNNSPWLDYSTPLPLLSLSAGNYWISILEFDTQTPATGGSQWLWGRSSGGGVTATRSGDTDDWLVATGNAQAFTLEGRVAGVPEPAALGLLGMGLFGLMALRRRRSA